MIVALSRWCKSLALRIPAQILRDVGAAEGSTADLSVEQGLIVIAPRAEPPRYTFDGLLAGITAENLHDDRFQRRSVTRSGVRPYCPDLGDLIFPEFSPHLGTEQGFTRPELVMTPRSYNGRVGRCFA